MDRPEGATGPARSWERGGTATPGPIKGYDPAGRPRRQALLDGDRLVHARGRDRRLSRRLRARGGCRNAMSAAAAAPPGAAAPLSLRSGPGGNNGTGSSGGSGLARRDGGRAGSARRDAEEGRGRHGPARTARLRPAPPGRRGGLRGEPLGSADMGKHNFHGKSRDGLIFSRHLNYFFC